MPAGVELVEGKGVGAVEFNQLSVVEELFGDVLALGEGGDRICFPVHHQYFGSPRQKFNTEQGMIQVLQIMG